MTAQNPQPIAFPDDFLFGVAAASYQVEGAASTEGRGQSVWDAFCRRPGAVFHGHTGAIACDQYHRYAEDAGLMAELGVQAYRLSVAWPRIVPAGDEQVNPKGLDYYDRLVDTLLARGVEPWVTLFHWDMPLWAFDRGGWLNRDSTDWFARYAEAVATRLGDRVRHWFTLNEPQIYIALGHELGIHAPGLKYDRRNLLRCLHHTLMAHGRAVQVLREKCPKDPRIGWAPIGVGYVPREETSELIEAARRKSFEVKPGREWIFSNTLFADPALLGHYPEDGLQRFGQEMPEGFEADLNVIHQRLDFYGTNIYHDQIVELDGEGNAVQAKTPPGSPITAFHWPVTPESLYWGPKFISERYNLPVYVTENGCASSDWVHADGHVHDAARVDFLCRYLWNVRRAVTEGVNVKGYFQWSILDNFEWAEGYRMRFGLVFVDYATQQRIPKDSYRFYKQVIRTRGRNIPGTLPPMITGR